MDLRLEKRVFCSNIKIISLNTMVLALVYIGAIYLMANRSSLSKDSMIFIGEQLLSPIGIVMFIRAALIEQECRVHEIIYSKIYPHWKIIFYRIIIISMQLFLVLATAFIPFKIMGVNSHIINALFGTYITAFYLGTIGMMLGYITREISVGILVPFLYYFFEMFSKGRLTKGLYLFGMSVGDYTSKIKLLFIAIIFIVSFLIIIKEEI